jgi:S1-C subfamily serine protease
LTFTVSGQSSGVKSGFLPMLAAGVLGGGVTAAALLGTGAAGDRVTRTVIEAPPLEATASPAAGGIKGLSAGEIYRRSAAGVALVRARSVQAQASSLDGAQRAENVATGSGFVIDQEGHLLTNAHLVAGATDVRVTFDAKKTVAAQVVGKDEGTDLAVLAVDPAGLDLRPLTLGDSGAVRVGDPTVSIGNPDGRARTLTTGVVSAKGSRVTAPSGFSIAGVVRTDAPLNPGNAGGPLLDSTGRVIGVNSQIGAGEDGTSGVGFAIPVDTAKTIIPRLEQHLVVSHAYLGVSAGDEAGLVTMASGESGVRVEEVDPAGPAARAGILGANAVDAAGGDVITAVDGRAVRSMTDVEAIVQRHRPGDGVAIRLLRDGEPITVQVQLTERPASVPLG